VPPLVLPASPPPLAATADGAVAEGTAAPGRVGRHPRRWRAHQTHGRWRRAEGGGVGRGDEPWLREVVGRCACGDGDDAAAKADVGTDVPTEH